MHDKTIYSDDYLQVRLNATDNSFLFHDKWKRAISGTFVSKLDLYCLDGHILNLSKLKTTRGNQHFKKSYHNFLELNIKILISGTRTLMNYADITNYQKYFEIKNINIERTDYVDNNTSLYKIHNGGSLNINYKEKEITTQLQNFSIFGIFASRLDCCKFEDEAVDAKRQYRNFGVSILEEYQHNEVFQCLQPYSLNDVYNDGSKIIEMRQHSFRIQNLYIS